MHLSLFSLCLRRGHLFYLTAAIFSSHPLGTMAWSWSAPGHSLIWGFLVFWSCTHAKSYKWWHFCWGSGILYLTSPRYTVTTRMKVGSCVSHFNVSLIVWAKSRDSVHKPQFLKRREVLLLTSQALYAKEKIIHYSSIMEETKFLWWHVQPCRNHGWPNTFLQP